MSSEEMVSSAIFSFLTFSGSRDPGVPGRVCVYAVATRPRACRLLFIDEGVAGFGESAGDRAVVEVAADQDTRAAEHVGIDGHLDRHLTTVHLCQPCAEATFLVLGERRGHGHVGDPQLPPVRGQLDEAGQRPGEGTATEPGDREVYESDRDRLRLAL